MKRVATLPIALALVASACTSGPPDRGARVLEAAGTVEVRVADQGAWVPLGIDAIVEPGSRVRVAPDGRLRMETAAASLLVAPIGSTSAEFVVGDPNLSLERGDVLVETAAEQTATVMARQIEIRIAGTVRVWGSLSLRVGSYRGGALAVVAGASLEVARLREAIFAGGALPATTTPIRLDPSDTFDALVVPELINLDRELAAVRTGYEAQFGATMKRVARLDPVSRDAGRPAFGFVQPLLARWRSGDIIVGVVLALIRDARGDGDLPTVFGEVRDLFDEGASWGVVAGTYDLGSDTVQERVARAVALVVGEVQPGKGEPIDQPPTPEPTTGPTSAPSPSPRPSQSPTPKPSASPKPSPSPSPTPSPSPSPTSSPDPTASPPVPPPPTGSCQPVDRIFGNC